MKRTIFLILFLFSVLFVLLLPAQALTMSVEGNYVNEQVKVTLDKPAFVIFRMNYGTPIFAEGLTAYFIPRVTGTLYIEAIAGDEKVNKTISIIQRSSSGESGRGNILPTGTFTKTVDGKTYTINWRTALGVLEKASRIRGFSYVLEEKPWGLYVKCVKDRCEKSEGATSGWMYWVNYPNEPLPGVSAEQCSVKEGDKVTWYFSRSMDETPSTSPYKIEISISSGYGVNVAIFWSSGGSGGGEASTTQSTQPTQTSQLTFSKFVKLQPNVETRIKIPSDVAKNLDILSLALKSDKGKEVLVEVSEAKFNVVVPRSIYKSFELSVDKPSQGYIEFRVSKDWLNSKGYSKDQVVLMEYHNRYIDLPTEVINEDKNYIYYRAEIKSFSTFAITVKWKGFPLNVTDEPIIKALRWLKTIQKDDGGFANPGEDSSISKTSWTVMALVAAKQNPYNWTKNDKSPIDYLRDNLNASLDKMGTADYARTILALEAVNEDPRNFSGIDLVERLKSKVNESGQIGDFIYTTIWGIIALTACGENVTDSVNWLIQQQNEDGGFAWAVGEKSDYDDTAAAIQALVAAGIPRDSEVIKKALEYLKTGQNDDGGFRYFGTSASNAASDAWIIQALVAAGENPMEWKKNNTSVVDHLLSLQTDEGYFKYTNVQTSNPGYMTVCAIMALLGVPHPIKAETFVNLTIEQEIGNVIPTPVSSTPVPTIQTTPTVVPTTPTKTTATTTPANTQSPRIPGFEVVMAIVAILVVIVRGKR